jgi:DNA polymerase elongation subunit (family B)
MVWELGRSIENATGRHGSKDDDRWGYTHGSTLKFDGRHCLPLWRILRGDVNLNQYTFENVVVSIDFKPRIVLNSFVLIVSRIEAKDTSIFLSNAHKNVPESQSGRGLSVN